MSDPITTLTTNPDQLGAATGITDNSLVPIWEPGGPLMRLPVKQLIGKLIKTELCKADQAALYADLAWAAPSVALVFADADPAKNGWYRKTGASGAGAWVQFEILSVSVKALADAAALLARHYANDDTNVDVPGGAAGDRGAKYWSNLAAVAAGTATGLDIVNRSLPKYRNLVDPAAIVPHNLVRADTGAYEDDGIDPYAATAHIPCEPLTLYTTRKALYGDGVRGRAYFDISGAFISGQSTAVAAGGNFTSPAAARSMAISLAFENNHAGNYIVKGALPPGGYRDFELVDATTAIRECNKVQDIVRPPLFNLLIRSRCLLGFATSAGGVSANAPYFTTGPLPIPASRALLFSVDFVPGASNYGWLFYDQNGVLVHDCGATFDITTHNGTANVELANLSGPVFVGMPIVAAGIPARSYLATGPADGGAGAYTIASAPLGGTAGAPALSTASATVAGTGGGCLANVLIRPPQIAVQARIAAQLDQLEGAYVYDHVPAAGEIPLGWDDLAQLKPLAGRNLLTMGDSIMAGAGSGGVHMWPLGIAQLTKATLKTQAEFSGAQVAQLLTAKIGGGVYSAADLAGVAASFNNVGTNNWGAVSGAAPPGTPYTLPYPGAHVGAIGDTSASGSFIGDLHGLYVEKIFAWDVANNNRNAVHLLGTVIRRYDNGTTDGDPVNAIGEKLSDYRQATIDFCNWVGMPYIDLWNVAGLDRVRGPGQYTDGLHASGQTCQKILAPQVARKLESLASIS